MHFERRSRFRLLLIALGALLSGCSGGPGGSACADVVTVHPFVGLIRPVPNSTANPSGTTTILYASNQVVPIMLSAGSAVVSVTPTALPSPLPSPLATPLPGQQYFASTANLLANTTYTAAITQTEVFSCGPMTKSLQEQIGVFSTR